MDADVLSNLMYLNMAGMEKTKLEFTEQDFLLGFKTFAETF